MRSLGLHLGFIGNRASGPSGGYARFNDAFALPPPPPQDLRRGCRPGAHRQHAPQRDRAGQGPPRLPVRRLARHGQDVDGEAARLRAERRGRPARRLRPRRRRPPRRSSAGTSLDVVEMDAASNNSVDDIRELRENVALAPMQGGKRVYILDEAHMLSTAAWNAFLKTLEEPPQHVVFVLATTEAHKVPATIVDRCHRFDFQRPVARADRRRARAGGGRGGDRDPRRRRWACSPAPPPAASATRSGTLEQLVTYGGNEVKLDDVLEILGVADAELVLDAGEALADRDPRAALLTVQSLSDSGRDFTQFMRDLSAHLRHLFVVQTLGRRARLVLRHRRAHRPPGRPGRPPLPGRDPARDRLPGVGDRRRQGRLASRASSSRWRC